MVIDPQYHITLLAIHFYLFLKITYFSRMVEENNHCDVYEPIFARIFTRCINSMKIISIFVIWNGNIKPILFDLWLKK